MAGEAIFVGYRRDDTADVAGRIYDAMAQRFGRQRVFKDVDNIGPGVDFGDYIKTVLPRCRVALVLIGPYWLESKDETGNRRLDDGHDWVRIEIETALATPGVLVVPVLVNGARMPRGEEVPDSLKPLLRRNAAIIRRDPDFHDDVERLAAAIRSSVNTGIIDLSKIGGKSAGPAPASSRERNNRTSLLIGGAIATALVLAASGFGVSRWLPTQGGETSEEQTAAVEPAPQDGTETQQPQTQEPLAQQPSASSPTQSASATPPAPTRVEEPARTAPTTAAPPSGEGWRMIAGSWVVVEGACAPIQTFSSDGSGLTSNGDWYRPIDGSSVRATFDNGAIYTFQLRGERLHFANNVGGACVFRRQ